MIKYFFDVTASFALWIGGALLLGRIGAKGPQIMQVIFGRTPLLKDVKRGLKGSGSAESVNRLAVIMLLTLSIVTLAAVQGYTGTLVDEKTVDATVGSDLQIQMEQNVNESEMISIIKEYADSDVTPIATTVPQLALSDELGGENLQTYVLLENSNDVLKWSEQALPGDDIDDALDAYQNGGFSAGQDAAYSLDLPGSDRGGDENRLDDELLKRSDEKSEVLSLVWEKLEFNFSAGGSEETDPNALFFAYTDLMEGDWSGLTLTEQDMNERNLGRVDISITNFSGSDLSNVNLSESIFFNTDLSGADLTGANLENAIIVNFQGGSIENADLTDANLNGLFGQVDLSAAVLSNTTCPDGSNSDETGCASGVSEIPPPLAEDLFFEGTRVQLIVIPHKTSMYYMGTHEYIPGVGAATIASALIIGEDSWTVSYTHLTLPTKA